MSYNNQYNNNNGYYPNQGYSNVPMQTYPNGQYPQQQGQYNQNYPPPQQQGYYANTQGGAPQFPNQQNYSNYQYSPQHHHQQPTYPQASLQQPAYTNNSYHTSPSSGHHTSPHHHHHQQQQQHYHQEEQKQDDGDEIKLDHNSAFTAADLAADVNKQSGTSKIENKIENVVGEDTLDVAKKVINTIRKFVLTIVFFVTPIMAVVSLVMAVIAWTQFFGNFTDFQTIIDSWKIVPITDIQFVDQYGSCASGYEFLSPVEYSNLTLNATVCWNKTSITDSFNVRTSTYGAGACPDNNSTLANLTVTKDDELKATMNFWRGTKLCVKRDGVPALERVPLTGNSCEDGYFKCEGRYPTCQKNGIQCPLVGASSHSGSPRTYQSFESPRYLSKTDHTIVLTTKGNNLPLVNLKIAPGVICENKKVGKERPALGTTHGRYSVYCTADDTKSSVYAGMDNATEGVLLNATGLNSLWAPSDANSYLWYLNGESEVQWDCSASRSEVARSGSYIQVVFYSQMTLFILTLFSSFITGLCIPVMLIYNGHLRSLWCGKNEVAEKDRDDLKRYNLVQVAVKCIIQTIRFIPIIAVMVIAGNYGAWFAKIAEEIERDSCADRSTTGTVFKFFSTKINNSIGALNICLLVSSVLSYLGTWGSIAFVLRMIVINLKSGRSAFSRPDSKTGTSVFSFKRLFGK
mmetsp:Transcript_3121/g.4595  ORF Transcript_3121/g.4595 Transcript_3121/m.4595 type:complete len:687 (-) Transcript_3121:307-2367(-)